MVPPKKVSKNDIRREQQTKVCLPPASIVIRRFAALCNTPPYDSSSTDSAHFLPGLFFIADDVILLKKKEVITVKADCHMHMVLDGVDWKQAIARHTIAPDEAFIRSLLRRYADLGYTYLRDGGDKWGVGAKARELARDFGITYRTPLAPLCKAGHYGSFIGRVYETLKEYADLVVKTRENGGNFIKIMISGLMDFDRFGVLTEEGLTQKEIAELIHIAHQEGMSVMAHANGKTAYYAAVAGVDSVEHGAYLEEETLHAMKDAGAVWVPTLSTVGNLRGKGRFNDAAVEKILESALMNVAAFHQMGGLLASGTDAGAWAVPHGCATEEGYFAMAGVDETALSRGLSVIQAKF